jgi:hypothetical protein
VSYIDSDGAAGGILGGVGPLVVPVPTAPDGCGLLLVYANDVGCDPDPTPDGWVLLATMGIVATSTQLNVWGKIAASEPASYSYPFSSSTSVQLGALLSYTDAPIATGLNRSQSVQDTVGVGHIDNDQAAGSNPFTDTTVVEFGLWVKGNNNVSSDPTFTPDPSLTSRIHLAGTQFGVFGYAIEIADVDVTSAAGEPAWTWDVDFQVGALWKNSALGILQTFNVASVGGGPAYGMAASAPAFMAT